MRAVPGPGGTGALIDVKVVPGASRSRISGPYGDGVKVQVAAPPEKGQANAAVCETIAAALGIRPADVLVVRGATSPRKTIHVRTLAPEEVLRRLVP